MNGHDHGQHKSAHTCSCCGPQGRREAFEAMAMGGVSRRDFLVGLGTAAVAGGVAANAPARAAEAPATRPVRKPASELVVQPVLTYHVPQRRSQTSWRPWGGIQTEAHAAEEMQRIEMELGTLVKSNRLAVKLLPVVAARNPAEAARAAQSPCDAMLIYASGGGRDTFEALITNDKWNLVFLRHNPGPVSLWYEIMHPHMMRKASDEYRQRGLDNDDVVVDEYGELAWRLNALAALRKTLGQRIVAIGGAGGWGDGHRLAPPFARETWQLDIIDVPYAVVGRRIEAVRKDAAAVAAAKQQAGEYLARPNVKLETDRKAVDNAFLLYRVFKELMAEHDATAMTIQHCMGTIMPLSETTACLPLSLINDEGLLAFCESDFVVIPSGMLMHHIAGLPVFLNDPTWPHNGVVTVAHCTAPSRMDGKNREPVTILTHFESDYGAAPKVDMRIGQVATNVVPDFASKKWIGFTGKVIDNPFLDICRSQSDIAIDGDWKRLRDDMRGFHWMMVYGDCCREVGYAIRKLGIEWENVSA